MIPQGLQMHDEDGDENSVDNENKPLDEEQNLQLSTSKNAKSVIPQGSHRCIKDDNGEDDVNDDGDDNDDEDKSDVGYKNETKDEEEYTQQSTSKKLQTASQMYGEDEESDDENEIKGGKLNKQLSISKKPKDDENDINDKEQRIQLSNLTKHLTKLKEEKIKPIETIGNN